MHRFRLICLIMLIPGLAHAYIDSGTGAYLVQTILTLIGVLFFYLTHPLVWVRSILNKLKNSFKKKEKDD